MLCGLEYQLFGLCPGGYHVVSLLFHGAVSVALYALVIAIVRRARPDFDPGLARLAGAIAVLSWSVHPLRVEAVAWASCQGYLPCAFFAILSARFYLAAHPPAGPAHFGWIAGALGSYVASLLCHATSLGLPVVLLALDFAVLQRLKSRSDVRRAVLQKWSFLIVAAAFTVMAFLGKNSGAGVVSLRSLSPAQRIAAASYAFCFYIVRTVLPFGLHVHRQFPADLAVNESRFLISLLAACAVCSAAILQRRSRPWLLAVVAAYLVILTPNSGLLAFGGQIVADRYAYLSMIPWALALSQGLMIMKPRPIRRILLVAAPALTLLGILTWKQCYTWRSSEALWVHAIEGGETDNAVVLGNLGADLLQQGRVHEADAVLRRSLDLEPNSRVANDIGRILDRRGMIQESIAAFKEAVELDPHDPEPRANLARAFAKQNRLPQALEQFAAAVRLRPDSASLRQEYGELLAREGRLDESTVQFRHAIQLEPDVPIGHLFLGRALVELGRRDEAAIALGNAVRLRPDVVGPRFELALLYVDLGRTREAMLQLSEVLRLDPRHAAARRAQSRLMAAEQEGGSP